MKNPIIIILTSLLTFCSVITFAQTTSTARPYLFNNYPDVIKCTAAQLSAFFTAAQGQNVNVSFNNNLTLTGTVKRSFIKYNNLQTVIVKLSGFNNILFSVSKRTDQYDNIIYAGHLFDNAYADGYEIKKTGQENYQFTKISMDKILPTCNQQ